jgi:alpha-tubulin suppressor-like RCC1 family protein
VKLCAGATHACGLMPSGKLTCWGRNDDYQLDVGREAPSERYVDLACGDYHTCAITTTGAVRCAGRNRSGQVSLAPSDSGYAQISAGDAHSCALRSDGSALCWGDASHGQNAVPSGTPALKAISSGTQFNCGLRKADGLPVCWGNPGSGRLTPPQHAFLKIDAGGESACGISTNGKVECWGLGSSERMLDAVELSVDVHTSVSSLHACAIRSDRSLYCWDSDLPAPTMDAQKFAAVAVGPTAICTLTKSGMLTCTPDEPTASIATAKPPNYPDEPVGP